MILLTIYFLIILITDGQFYILPDLLTFPSIIVAIIISIINPQVSFAYYLGGGLLGFLFLFAIGIITKKAYKKETLGGGDIKLAILLGIITGYQGIILAIFIAALLGLLYSGIYALIKNNRINKIPFGPFLVVSAIGHLLTGDQVISAYLNLFQ